MEHGETLGHATLDLEANLGPFVRNMQVGRTEAGRMENSLDAVARISELARAALNRVKTKPGQAAESSATLEVIERSVGRVNRNALEAADHLEQVKLTARQSSETEVAGGLIDRVLKRITRNANEARRALESVKITGGVPGRSGVGVGPFGSGFGRVGVLGAAIGAGTLLGPAAGPGVLGGAIAAATALAPAAVGALGTLALAFQGVGKAIGGDLKAFKALQPAQQQFVLTIRSLTGWINKLKQVVGSTMFPGLTAGLKAALSPGTVGAITTAVREFATAIGNAGAAWGKYFGSPEFRELFAPLMASGARTLTLMSDAAMQLFDALGVLLRSAIPLTDWITTAIGHGAKLADTWLRAKDASGDLSKTMDEAKVSLRLVGGLLVSIARAVGALGKALYPVSKIAVKDLTDGFNALARMITRNQDKIREIVGGALAALVSTVKTLTPIVAALARALDKVAHAVGGWKTVFEIVIGGMLAKRFVALGLKVAGVAGKIGLIGAASKGAEGEVGLLGRALLALGGAGVLASLGALAAAVIIVGDAVRDVRNNAKDAAAEKTLSDKNGTRVYSKDGRIYQRTVPYGGGPALTQDITDTAAGKKWAQKVKPAVDAEAAAKAAHGKGSLPPQFKEPGTETPYLSYLLSKAQATAKTSDDRSVLDRIVKTLTARLGKAYSLAAKTALQSAINATKDQIDALNTSPFGADPAFTKNVPKGKKPPKPPVIPALASRAEALARANASKASVLGNVGETAKRYLELELQNLNTADKSIKAKLKDATGKARTQLFAAMTSVENRMRSVRAQIRKAIQSNRAAELQFAVDQAKDAVASAREGTAAYDNAVAAEAKALRAQIKYLDARVHNSKLSLAVRSSALRKETADKKALSALLKQDKAAAAGANESQFLSAFSQIVKAYAPNAFPKPQSTAQTNTKLHEAVTELRENNQHLKDIKRQTSSPSSARLVATAEAVLG